ncbi:MAG TPA: 2-dehydro-3-deoxygalactonokinase, partial [Devosia sp.]|nr:2-dehydro-3-deoxygalactonokinase [Devosia sp.]
RTCMTGEFYGLLSQHSILSRTLDAGAPLDKATFMRGVTRASEGNGLLHDAFGVRALALFDRLSPVQSASYLSGLLIGEELRHEAIAARDVIAIGAPALTARYALALKTKGVAVRCFGGEATWAGLRALQG